MVITILLILLLSIIAGISKTIVDLCSESAFYKSKLVTKFNFNPKYWHRSEASGNKWKNGDKSQGEAYWGSSRWFVMFTDGWHLFNTVLYLSLIFIGFFGFMNIIYPFGGMFVFLTTFELLYSWLKK